MATSHGGVVLVIPSIGAGPLVDCLRSVAALDPGPDRTVLVWSGTAEPPPDAPRAVVIRCERRLSFSAALNSAITQECATADQIAVLNDDATPPPGWLAELHRYLDRHSGVAAVQGTVTDASGRLVDGRGITLDRFGLPVQLDHGQPMADESTAEREVIAVSGTAALYRAAALRETAIETGAVLDPAFGSYHEDLDLGLRLRRLGWSAAWIGGVPTRHIGSATGRRLSWRHPWWLLANRWRALAGNLAPVAFLRLLPVLLRGELRAVRTLLRSNPRVLPVAIGVQACLPMLIAAGWRRATPGPRLATLAGLP